MKERASVKKICDKCKVITARRGACNLRHQSTSSARDRDYLGESHARIAGVDLSAWRCCFGLTQITRTTPRRWITCTCHKFS